MGAVVESEDAVTSEDGTTIGYRKLGDGPGLVLLHGGVNASQHMLRLARALADAFTLYLPDRRGRGSSGPYGPGYGLDTEDQDLAALVRHTGAELVFGAANGGLFALHGALGLPQVRKVAAYEPLLLTGSADDARMEHTLITMQQRIRSGRLGDAVMSSIRAAVDTSAARQHSPTLARVVDAVPDRLGAAAIDLFLRSERPRRGRVAWRDLLRSLPEELDPVLATRGTLEDYRRLDADVLLLHGDRTDRVFVATASELHRVLPRSVVVALPGLDHDSIQTYGKPDTVAAALRVFFSHEP